MSERTIFERIVAGEATVKKVYEDEHTLAFHDIAPQAPVHVLVLPKTKIVSVAGALPEHAEVLGRVLLTAQQVAQQLGIAASGYRIVFNCGQDGGQTVNYLHAHVMGGRALHAMG